MWWLVVRLVRLVRLVRVVREEVRERANVAVFHNEEIDDVDASPVCERDLDLSGDSRVRRKKVADQLGSRAGAGNRIRVEVAYCVSPCCHPAQAQKFARLVKEVCDPRIACADLLEIGEDSLCGRSSLRQCSTMPDSASPITWGLRLKEFSRGYAARSQSAKPPALEARSNRTRVR